MRESERGYRVGGRSTARFVAGHLDGEMTYGEAASKARELSAQDKEKTYYPELIITEGS
jgi:hypothetical protein